MHIEVTNDPSRRIEQAKAIVEEKRNYYTDEVLESIRITVREKTTLTDPADVENEMYKTIYFYWVYGCSASEYYYLEFPHKTHEEIKEYVTMREKVVFRNRLNRLADAHILNNKWDSYCYFKEYYGRDVIKLENEKDYPIFCSFVKKHPVFVAKPTDMGGGRGVHKISTEPDAKDSNLKRIFDELLAEITKNKKMYMRGEENSIILEELIKQDPATAAFHPYSVNAVRVPTIRIGDTVHIYHPWFKIGRGGEFLTSAVFGTMDAGIDPVTGVVNTPGYTENFECFEMHPDSGIQFSGFQIPKWNELVKIVTEMALKLDTIHYVGWDMVLSESGWIMMEGNFTGDFMWQMIEKKGTKKELEDLIGWKLTKDFWWQE